MPSLEKYTACKRLICMLRWPSWRWEDTNDQGKTVNGYNLFVDTTLLIQLTISRAICTAAFTACTPFGTTCITCLWLILDSPTAFSIILCMQLRRLPVLLIDWQVNYDAEGHDIVFFLFYSGLPKHICFAKWFLTSWVYPIFDIDASIYNYFRFSNRFVEVFTEMWCNQDFSPPWERIVNEFFRRFSN